MALAGIFVNGGSRFTTKVRSSLNVRAVSGVIADATISQVRAGRAVCPNGILVLLLNKAFIIDREWARRGVERKSSLAKILRESRDVLRYGIQVEKAMSVKAQGWSLRNK